MSTNLVKKIRNTLARRGQTLEIEVAERMIARTANENPSLSVVDMNAFLDAMSLPANEDQPFHVTATSSKDTVATGSVVVTGTPAEAGTITLSDGTHTASVFEFDGGNFATATLTFTGVPADTGICSISDGTTSKVLEFDTGVLGVASTGGLITFTAVPLDTNTITLTTSTAAGATATVYEFNNIGGVTTGHIAVLPGATTIQTGAEFAAAVNATGGYVGNGSTGFTATDNGNSTVTLVRTATGAGSETITRSSGVSQVETATAVGTITVGVNQVETATVVGSITPSTGAGNATVIVTAAGMTGSAVTLHVALAASDSASQVATKIRAAMVSDANVGNVSTGFFTVTGANADIILTAKTKAADDATLNVSIDNDTCTGLTTEASSADTTAGVAPGTGNATVVTTASGVSGTPITTSVAVVAGDVAATWAGKVRTALGNDANITALYTVGGSSATISLTRILPATNDSTLNINLDNGTCTGITTAASSANSTAGVAQQITVTTSFSGGVTQVAVGSAITATRIGVGTAATPGGTAVSTATVCTNLLNAINAVAAPAFLFTATQGAGTTVTLTANTRGTAGNAFTLTQSATNFAVTGAGTFGNGLAAGSGTVSGTNIAVAIGTTAALTATALYTAVNAASATLSVTATNGTAGTCSLANTGVGTAGNVTITKTATNCTLHGMSGGTNGPDVELISDATVGTRTVFVTGFEAFIDTTSWNEATALVIESNDGDEFFSIAKSALVGDASVRIGTSGVTNGDAYKLGTGGTEGSGLRLNPTGNEQTGGAVTVSVWGILRNV